MNQSIRLLFLFVFVCLSGLALSCGGDDVGIDCDTSSDCDDGLQCVPLAFGCVDSKSCISTCEKPCDSDSDCGGGDSCENRNGHLICRSTDPARPWE